MEERRKKAEQAFKDYEGYFKGEKKLRKTKKEEKRLKGLLEKELLNYLEEYQKLGDEEKGEARKVYKEYFSNIEKLRDSDVYKKVTKIPMDKLDIIDLDEVEREEMMMETPATVVADTPRFEPMTPMTPMDDEDLGPTPRMEAEMVEEEEKVEEEEEKMPDEEVKEEVKVEEKEKPMMDKDMEEIHNQIRMEERKRTMEEFKVGDFMEEGKIKIPEERLGVEGKTIAILNDDIQYFIKRFPDNLKTEANVYKKANKRNKKLLVDIHKRIQAKLSSPMERQPSKSERIGIVLDADKYIDTKINELLASKTLEGLTPANLVDITKIPTSKGKDLGSYTIINEGGKNFVDQAPVYRAIPSSNEEQAVREEQAPMKGEIAQSTIYKNSGLTKVDIAKMEIKNNPFIKTRNPRRLNIIL